MMRRPGADVNDHPTRRSVLSIADLQEQLASAQADIADARQDADRTESRAEVLTLQLLDAEGRASTLSPVARAAARRAGSIAQRAVDVRSQAQDETTRFDAQRRQTAQEAQRQAERFTQATSERNSALKEARQAVKEAVDAREASARLQGQAEALQLQVAELPKALGDRQTPPGART